MRINKTLLLSLLTPCFALSLHAEVTDSIAEPAYDLSEVTVTAQNTTLLPDGYAARPTDRQRKTSDSGLSLLEHMQLPMLRIDPLSKQVSFNTGERATYFINGIPATEAEVKGIRPANVKRIEILRDPTGSQFEGKEAVVNFIVKTIAYGGYVTADATQTFIYNTGKYGVYSKYATDRWTFQATGGMSYIRSHGDSIHQAARYAFRDMQPIELLQKTCETRHLQREYYGGLQAMHRDTAGNTLVITAGARKFATPDITRAGAYTLDGVTTTDMRWKTSSEVAPYLQASYLMKLNTLQVKVNAGVSGSFNDSRSTYSSADTSILNGISEKSVSPTLAVYADKELGTHDVVTALAEGTADFYRTHYTGTVTSEQNLTQQRYKAGMRWKHTFNDSWNIQTGVAVPVSVLGYNDAPPITDVYPDLSLSGRGNIAGRHSLSLSARYTRIPLIVSSFNDIRRPDTGFEGTAGNPDLTMTRYTDMRFSYMWLKSNALQFGATAGWTNRRHNVEVEYFPADGIIYNRLANRGIANLLDLSINAYISLFSGRLVLSPYLLVSHVYSNGIYPVNFWSPWATLSVTYMPTDHLYAVLYASTPGSKTYYKNRGGYAKDRDYMLYLQFGYYRDNFSASLMYMPLNRMSRSTYTAANSTTDIFNREWHNSGKHRIEVSVSYCFNFGKKTSVERLHIDDMRSSSVR